MASEFIQKDSIGSSMDSIMMMAALSADYEAVHVIDLDRDTIRSLKLSDTLSDAGYKSSATPYRATAHDIVERLVDPESRDKMHAFLDPDNLKAMMAQEKRFSYRYAVVPDEKGRYVYEMVFVNIGSTPDEHLLVAGAKCIDDILKLEREQGQYNAALLHDAKFFYEFDVTDGRIRDPFHISDGYDPFFGLEMRFPILYDRFNDIRTIELGMRANTEKESLFWTCKGLRSAFEKGKRIVSIRYSSEKLKMSWRASIILTKDPVSRHLHAVYVCRDVTEEAMQEKQHQMELEHALREARRANAAKSEFLTRVSHDIRTPLNGILGVMALNEKHADDPAFVAENNKRARVAANHLLSLINDVLDLSKMESGDVEMVYEPVNISEIVMECFMMSSIQAREKGIRMFSDGGVNMIHPHVIGSPLRLRQIFTNILNNCVKYNKPDGSIICSSEAVSHDEDHVTYRFVIEDTGIGMGKEYLERIFNPFSQERDDARSRFQGTGMGMAIVKTLVDRMDGTIEVDSAEGVGSRFTITLPFDVCHDSVASPDGGSGDAARCLAGRSILLVEDNDLNREMARCILEDAGMVVTDASDGVQAYETYMSRPEGSFDAILMDIMMPNLDGYGATMLIRRSEKKDALSIPIIAMTANAFESDKRDALEAGMNAHVPKPIDIDLLFKILSDLFRT